MTSLYHYTSVYGFEGIVRNKAIRMTKSEFLNDPYDCHLFVEIIGKYLKTHQEFLSDVISSVQNDSEEVRTLYSEKGCDLVRYIEYVQKSINVYVMSFTKQDDTMNMWNYYGQGGMEVEILVDGLVDSLRSTLGSEREFLTKASVIYANIGQGVEDIKVPNFSDFVLMSRDSENIFEEHRSYIKEKSYYQTDQLYATSNLGNFLKTYIKGYIYSLSHLLKCGEIDEDTDSHEVFRRVFQNTAQLNDDLFWKHDLSLYMLVLSALIKSDTYQYEDEYRIVYFEHNIEPDKEKDEEYAIKNMAPSCFLHPYITFQSDGLLRDALKSVTISPVTRNLPIDNEAYVDTVKRFLVGQGLSAEVEVKYSKHNIRW